MCSHLLKDRVSSSLVVQNAVQQTNFIFLRPPCGCGGKCKAVLVGDCHWRCTGIGSFCAHYWLFCGGENASGLDANLALHALCYWYVPFSLSTIIWYCIPVYTLPTA